MGSRTGHALLLSLQIRQAVVGACVVNCPDLSHRHGWKHTVTEAAAELFVACPTAPEIKAQAKEFPFGCNFKEGFPFLLLTKSLHRPQRLGGYHFEPDETEAPLLMTQLCLCRNLLQDRRLGAS